MKTLRAMSIRQLSVFACFLEEHPGFSPELIGDDANVYGFRVGEYLLSVGEMETLIATEVHFDEQQAALLRLPPSATSRRTMGLP